MKTSEILYPALRQYRHNIDNGELVIGFDHDKTVEIFARLTTNDRWRKVEDELPDNNNEVLMYSGDYGYLIGWYDTIDKKWECAYNISDDITNWMPLSDPPADL